MIQKCYLLNLCLLLFTTDKPCSALERCGSDSDQKYRRNGEIVLLVKAATITMTLRSGETERNCGTPDKTASDSVII